MNTTITNICLTSLHRRLYKHAICFWTADRRASERAFRFLCVLAGALSTCHAWLAIVVLVLCTRNRLSESMGSRLCGPGQKALQAMNELTLFVDSFNPFIQDLCLWRTSQEFVKTDLYPLSLISLRNAVCLTWHWSIIGRCFGACQRSNCAEERRP